MQAAQPQDATQGTTTRTDRKLELTILRESVNSRARQAPIAFVGTSVGTIAFILLLSRNAAIEPILLWMLPMVMSVGWRVKIAWRVGQAMSNANTATLVTFDRKFLLNSVFTQIWTGAGMWLVVPYGNETTPYFMTIAVCLFGVGALLSLANDFRSIVISIPLLFGQNIAYWLMQGTEGINIAVPMLLMLLLALSFGRQTQRTNRETIRTRFQNDDLLDRLEEEKRIALHALAQAEEANRSKSRFLAAASHDLRQPLHAISLHRDTLALKELPTDARDIVDQQGIALTVLVQLFDNLLEMSRLESGSVEVARKPTRLQALLDEVKIEFNQAARNKNLFLHVQSTSAYVDTDRNLMMRLLRNLVSNAVRYTNAGRIDVECEVDQGLVHVRVKDTGPGIPPEDQERVFGEFVQLSNPARDRTKGVGLGLSIVKRIADLLEIGLRLQSTVGIGTEISFHMPQIEAPELEQPASNTLQATQTQTYVWVVEDDRLLREALAQNLAALGFNLDVAADPAEARALAETHGAPDIAIVDDMLGLEETGLELAKWLESFMPREAILLITGNVEPERVETLSASPYTVMRKPVATEELLRWMHLVSQP